MIKGATYDYYVPEHLQVVHELYLEEPLLTHDFEALVVLDKLLETGPGEPSFLVFVGLHR